MPAMTYPARNAEIVYFLIAVVVVTMAVRNRSRLGQKRIAWKSLAMLALLWAAIAIIAIVVHR